MAETYVGADGKTYVKSTIEETQNNKAENIKTLLYLGYSQADVDRLSKMGSFDPLGSIPPLSYPPDVFANQVKERQAQGTLKMPPPVPATMSVEDAYKPQEEVPISDALALKDINTEPVAPEPWQTFYKEPSTGDIAELSHLYQTSYGYGITEAKARALEVLTRQAEDKAKADYEKDVQEKGISGYLSEFSEKQKQIRADLATELGKYQSELYKNELLPQIYQTMAARGLSGGSLDEAIAKSAERLSSAREQSLAGMGTQSALTGSQLELENLLRKAGEAGTSQQNLGNIAQQYGAESREKGYASGQNALSQAFQKEMQNLTYKQQLDLYNKQRADQQSDIWQQALGGLLGTGLRTAVGAGIGALSPAIGAGPGAISGLTGSWWTGK